MFIEIAHATTEAAQESASPDILGSLGINWKIFIAQLINFAVVLFVLWKWAWKPTIKLLDDRSKKVEQSLQDVKRIEEEMKNLDKKRNEGLREAEQKAQVVIVEATKVAKETQAEIISDAQKEADRVLEAGQKRLESEKEKILAEAKTELADLVVKATEKILEEKMDSKRDKALIEKVLEKVR